ncbi:MAG: DNA-processing protein DprA [Bdellovibrionales bacterium]|nr:DNA-processing protein DprA [Bdellovibrionales bacterium]
MFESKRILISENEKKWCLNSDVKLTYPGDSLYPQSFYNLELQPSYLFYMGEPIWQTHKLLSVVGSRTPQLASLNWLDQTLGDLLTNKEFAIVSGGARGIDQKAHQMAVRMGRPTLVFLPSGLMCMYPKNLVEWVRPILQAGGCIMSQFTPNAEMRKGYFRKRNELIAAVSPMTLVVECKRRSGTLLTAGFALTMGKTVGVMPTFPGEAGMGGLDILQESPALVIRDSMDIQSAFNDISKLISGKS